MKSREHRGFVCIVAAGAAASIAALHTNSPVGVGAADPAPHISALSVRFESGIRSASAVVPGETRAPPDSSPGFEALEQSLDAADPALRDHVLSERLPTLTLRDPTRAARFAELQTDARLRELALLQVAMAWARNDEAAAVHWAESLTDVQMRDAAITDISLALAETSPARAVALRERFVDANSTLPDNTLVNLAHQWAQQDFQAALAWANAQPSGVQRDQILQRLVFVRAEAGDFSAATELALSTIAAPDIRAEALAAVAQQEG